jgi:hypothetical protein
VTRRRDHAQGTYELLQEQVDHVNQVPCPTCGAEVGQDCLRLYAKKPRTDIHHTVCPAPPDGCGADMDVPCAEPHGVRRSGLGCWRRVAAADTAFPDRARCAVPEPPTRPQPGRRLLPIEEVRRDVAEHRTLCGWCRHPIVWATNPKGDQTPIDAEPNLVDGDQVLTVDDRGPRSHPLTAQQLPAAREHGQRLHTRHRTTCPQGGRANWSRGVRHNHNR